MRMDATGFNDFLKAFEALPDPEKKEALALADAECASMAFVPNPGPQTEAYYCLADEMFYGGAGGGGKTSLLCGLPLNEHHAIQLFRRESTQLRGVIEELTRIIGHTTGLNQQTGVWRFPGGKTIELGGIKDENDKFKWQGRAADFKGFDEITHFTRSQYRFIIGWNRSTRPGQRCRVVATGNPPMDAQGAWVIEHWAPWLMQTHPDPAKPGDLRWPVRVSDKDQDREIFFHTFEEAMAHLETLKKPPRDLNGNIIPPRSRTFIPASLEDNPDLMRSGYAAVVAGMPKEIRAAMEGDFNSAMKDGEAQVIPTAWVMAAQARWKPDGNRDYTDNPDGDPIAMSAMAFDPAGGGADEAVLAWRHGPWYAPMIAEASPNTADGSWSASLIAKHRRDGCPVVVDAGGGKGHGFGGTTIMRLKDNNVEVRTFNGALPSLRKTRDGTLRFANKRAEAYWVMREELDPDQPGGAVLALPPDPELLADLTAARFTVTARGILIGEKDDVRDLIGRSPGKGDAVVMCLSEGNIAIQKLKARRASGGLAQQADLGGRRLHGQKSRQNRGDVIDESSSSSWRDEQGL